jgi:hypothetical protein
MTDQEVGELSNALKTAGDDSAYHWQWQCELLIDKLIEERKRHYQTLLNLCYIDAEKKARRDFGILDA